MQCKSTMSMYSTPSSRRYRSRWLRASASLVACVFGLNHILVAGNALQGFTKVHVRAVLIGDVEKVNSVIEGVADNAGKLLDAQTGLIAGLTATYAPCTHANQRDLDAALAQRHHVGRALG